MYIWYGLPLILASASPRRSELLTQIGIPFEKHPADCDETLLPGESAAAMVERLSFLKAKAIAARFPERIVLGADTTVVIDGEILGKPSDVADADRMLSRIAGRTHEVVGGCALVCTSTARRASYVSTSLVTLRGLSPRERARYIETREPMDKAGAYAIQGIGASLVSSVVGSYTNVVGLDVARLIEELTRLGAISQ